MRSRPPRPALRPRAAALTLALVAALAGVAPAAAQSQQQNRAPAAPRQGAGAAPAAGVNNACFEPGTPAVIIAACNGVLQAPQGLDATRFGEALQNRAEALIAQARFEAAIGDFQEMVKRRHNVHVAHTQIGSIHLRQRRYAEAQASFTAALAANPGHAVAARGLGQALLALNQPGDAITYLNQALKASATDTEAHALKGMAHAAQGQLEDAIRSYSEALRLAPGLTAILVLRAQAHADQGDAAAATRDANQAIANGRGEERLRALALRGRLRNAAGNPGGAFEDCSEATGEADRTGVRDIRLRTDIALCLAIGHRSRGRLPEARDEFDRALQWSRNDLAALTGRGHLSFLRGHHDEAIADLEAALRVAPRAPDALRFLGLAHAEKGEPAKALEVLERAAVSDPRDPWPLMLRAAVLARAGERTRALKDMGDAMQLAGEQSSDAHLARGAVYYDLEDLDAARRDLETAVRLNPESAQALAQLGRLNLRQGRVEAAAQALDAARRHAPHDLQLGTLRGLLALARNDFAQALAELSESIAINATQPLPFAARGQVHEAQGRREQAIADYQAASVRRAVDNDGRRAQQLARERLAALRAAPRGETGGLDTARSDGNGEPGRSGAVERHAGRRPPVGADADGRPASLVCRMVEGLFGSARHYTGVEFDTGCRPERVQASRGQAQ